MSQPMQRIGSLDAANPLARKDAGPRECQNLFIDNYKKCNNGGVGGSVQVGCLVYEFKATHDKK